MEPAALADDSVVIRNFDLVEGFMEFYAEVARHKRQVQEAMAAQAAEGDAPKPLSEQRTPPALDPERILQRLQDVLEAQALATARRGLDFMVAQQREAHYVMAALADDVFLYELDWPGRGAWRENVLENRVFGTRYAGERIFDRIEKLLNTRNRREIELAPVYLLALSLGFKGRMRFEDEGGKEKDSSRRERDGMRGGDGKGLETLRRKLFEIAFDRPADLGRPDRRLTPAAYGRALKGEASSRFRAGFHWSYAVAIILAAFMLVQGLVWTLSTSALTEAADQALISARGPR